MEKVEWNNAMSVHVNSMDSQHIKIIKAINLLDESLKSQDSMEILKRLFNELHQYSLEHFFHEEALMKKYKFSKITEHLKEHQTFIDRVQSIHDQYLQGQTRSSVELNLLEFLGNWLIHHIMRSDKEYTSLFVSNQVK